MLTSAAEALWRVCNQSQLRQPITWCDLLPAACLSAVGVRTLARSLKPCCTRFPAAPLSCSSRMVMRTLGSKRPASTACWTRHRLTGCQQIAALLAVHGSNVKHSEP